MTELLTAFRSAMLANPGAATVFLRRPILSEHLTRTTELIFSMLDQGDVERAAVAEAADAVVLLTMDSVVNDLTRPAAIRQQLVGQLPVEETPLLVEHIGAYSIRDGEQRFRHAPGWLLDGIERDAAMTDG